MRFGRIELDEAAGATLAHTQRLPGRVLKKGSVLDPAGIDALRAAGISSIIAARLDPGDVAENEAAGRLADALLSPGLRRTGAGTGRVNLAATGTGLLRVDANIIDAINTLDESLTIGTLADYATVAAREMVATIKIIPFSVPGAVLDRAIAAITAPPLTLHPFRPLRVGLAMSTLPGLKPSILAGTADATAARVAGLTGTMLPPIECAHTETAIADALASLMVQDADILLVSGASAVVDRRDVGPAGIVRAGGEILHFGMPVDPGNLICLGRIGHRPALVLPGCARSPKLNGIDWVLSRLFAGLPLGGREMAGMGVGGLLKDVAARPLPRVKATPTSPAPQPHVKSVAAVVLAAGQSQRMAPHHKLLVTNRAGKPMIARTVDNLLSSGARPVIVVVGHRETELRAALGGRPVTVVTAADFAAGLSASLRAGVAAVPADSAAAVVCLGDMPLVTGRMIDRLIEAHDNDEGRSIVVPTGGGKPGNPVLWDRRYFAEIAGLTGDSGARALLDRHADAVATVELGDAALRDFDTVESLAALPGHIRPVLAV